MLDLIFGSPARRSSAFSLDSTEGWPDGFGSWGGRTKAGVNVSESVALTYSAVWCATRVLCEPAGALPRVTYKRIDQYDREPAYDYTLFDIVKHSPNDEMSAQPFWEGRFQHAINWRGGGFAEIERESRKPESPVVNLWPIHASRVTEPTKQEADEGYAYAARNDDGSRTLFERHEIFHQPGVLSDDGIWSKGVIQWARESVGFGLAIQRHGSTYFGSGAQPRGIVTGLTIRDKEARKNFRREWKELHGNPQSDEIAILGPGTDYKQIQISNEDSQFIGTLQHHITEIARWYRVTPHMLMDMTKAGYASIEMTSIEFVMYSLWPWLARCEGQCNLKLIPRRDRSKYFIEHDVNALLRADIKTRFEAYRIAVTTGWMTLNQVCRRENLPGIGPKGDVNYVPLNMTTAERMMLGLDRPQLTGVGSEQSGAKGEQSLNGEALQKLLLTHDERATLNAQLRALEKQLEHKGDNGHSDNGSGRDAQTRSAARAVLRDALGRMFTKESNAVKRAAAKESCEAWLDEFYSKQQVTMTEALGPSVQVLGVLGISETAETLSAKLVEDSKNRISAALTASPATLIALLETWPTQRAESTTDEILKGAA